MQWYDDSLMQILIIFFSLTRTRAIESLFVLVGIYWSLVPLQL